MPFTPSHAVVALPFLRTPLVSSAIAIGAMTPDLPLFLRGIGLDYGFTHDFAQVIWTTLLAFALFLVWRILLRPAAGELAPAWLARRLPEEWNRSAPSAARQAVGVGAHALYPAVLALSLMLGVLSHLFWDLFTHEGRWGVQVFPVLGEYWGPLPGHVWLQDGSSVIGLAVIGVWAALWLRRRVPGPEPLRVLPRSVRLVWQCSLPALLLVVFGFAWCAYAAAGVHLTVEQCAYRVLPQTCAVWAVGSAALCAVVAVRRSRGMRHGRGSADQGRVRDTPGNRS